MQTTKNQQMAGTKDWIFFLIWLNSAAKPVQLQRELQLPSALGTSVLVLKSSCVGRAHVDRGLLAHIRVVVREGRPCWDWKVFGAVLPCQFELQVVSIFYVLSALRIRVILNTFSRRAVISPVCASLVFLVVHCLAVCDSLCMHFLSFLCVQLCITVPEGDCALSGISSSQFSCYFVSWGYFVRLLRLGAVFQILLCWILMFVNFLFGFCFLLYWTCSVVMCIPWGRVVMIWFFVSPLSDCKNSLFIKQLRRVRFLFVEKKWVTTMQLIFCLSKKRCKNICQLALAILPIVHLVANYEGALRYGRGISL